MLGGMSIIVVACSVQKIYILFNNIILFLWRFKSKNFKDLNLWRQNLWRPKTYEKWLPGTVFILKLMRYLIGEFVSYLSSHHEFLIPIFYEISFHVNRHVSINYLEIYSKSEAVTRRCPVKKILLKKFTIFTGKHLRWTLFSHSLQIIKKKLQYSCFSVNFSRNLKPAFLQNTCEILYLSTWKGSSIASEIHWLCGIWTFKRRSFI